jgi:porphobilinogen synthase
MGFPIQRPRRLRVNEKIRHLVEETTVEVGDLIYPCFVTHGEKVKKPVESMPGIYNLSVDMLLEEIAEIEKLGIPGVILFGLPSRKDEMGSEAYDDDGIVQRAVRALKQHFPNFLVITDVCLCGYTSHGHCGVVKEGHILNDPTLELLARIAISHARAGADIVAPSDMMDGRIGFIRKALDGAGFQDVVIMSYSVKYASAFYDPFREAAYSAPKFGDRRSYQMNPSNAREALREVLLDIEEGADIIMIKPALAYLDIICQVRERFPYPIAAYNVSGEYASIKAAALRGWIDEQRVVLEILTGIKRAGADIILTYHAKDVARWLKGG